MDKQSLIKMLNRDIADEHASTIRYLVHAYLEGEDTVLGSKLLSRSREEMWHMHWLGMIIGKLGGEPDMVPAPYPYDPSNRASIFESYVKYEKNLIEHYKDEADKVVDPHIKRVLQREGWESDIHAKKFQRILDKLTSEEATGLPGAGKELSTEFIDRMQKLVENKYDQVLHHLRNAWVFQREGMTAWQLMDFSMTKMKQLAHLAEPVAENGITPNFTSSGIKKSASIGVALKDALEDVRASRERHLQLRRDSETQKHAGMIIDLDLTVKQERYEEEEIGEW